MISIQAFKYSIHPVALEAITYTFKSIFLIKKFRIYGFMDFPLKIFNFRECSYIKYYIQCKNFVQITNFSN